MRDFLMSGFTFLTYYFTQSRGRGGKDRVQFSFWDFNSVSVHFSIKQKTYKVEYKVVKSHNLLHYIFKKVKSK